MRKLNALNFKHILGRDEMKKIMAGSGNPYQVCTDIYTHCANAVEEQYDPIEDNYPNYHGICKHQFDCCMVSAGSGGSC